MNSPIASPMRQSIDKLQAVMLTLPQIDMEAHTKHYFASGLYCRELFRPMGALIVGKVHKKEHLYIVASGTVRITNGDCQAIEIVGPKVIISQPGTKRAVYAVTDATCITVHATQNTDLEKVEAEIVEEDDSSPFTVGNKLKVEALCQS